MLAAVTLVAGCAESGSDKESGSSEQQLSNDEIYVNGTVGDVSDEGEPKAGGTLTIAEYSEARSLDPTKTIPNGATGGSAMAAVYDVLMRYDLDSATYEPQLAESLESEDNQTWTLTLREGVTFTDGTPVTPEAVVASIGYYMQNAGFGTLGLATNIKDMKPGKDNTVVFQLQAPWTDFPAMLAGGPGMVVAPASYKNPEKFVPIGAGPYKFDGYKPGEELVLTRNEDYWDGTPNLDSVRFIWLNSDETRLQALDSGTADTVYLRNAKVLEEAREDGYNGAMSVVGLGTMLWINNREDAPGSDVRVRQAMSLAIDRELIAERVNGGAGMPTASIVPEISAIFQDVDLADHDPEKAKALVEEAKADGFDGKLTYLGQADQQSQAQAVAVKASLEAVGFTVEIEALRNVADQVQRLYVDHTFDLATSSISSTEELLFARFSANIGTGSPQNPSGYANPEMDKLIGELRGAKTDDDKAAVMQQVNQLWQETQPGVVLSSGATFYPWSDEVHGVKLSTEQLLLLDDAWKG